MLKVYSFDTRPVLQNKTPVKAMLPKHSLKADTVTFTSGAAITASKPLIQRIITLFKPSPTPMEIARMILKYTSQIASLIGSGIAGASIVLRVNK